MVRLERLPCDKTRAAPHSVAKCSRCVAYALLKTRRRAAHTQLISIIVALNQASFLQLSLQPDCSATPMTV